MSTVVLTDKNFDDEVKNSKTPVLVSFWLNSYGGRNEHPFEAASDKLESVLKFGKIDISDQPDLAKEYKIRSAPTLLLFKEGKVTDTIVGVTRIDQLMRILQ